MQHWTHEAETYLLPHIFGGNNSKSNGTSSSGTSSSGTSSSGTSSSSTSSSSTSKKNSRSLSGDSGIIALVGNRTQRAALLAPLLLATPDDKDQSTIDSGKIGANSGCLVVASYECLRSDRSLLAQVHFDWSRTIKFTYYKSRFCFYYISWSFNFSLHTLFPQIFLLELSLFCILVFQLCLNTLTPLRECISLCMPTVTHDFAHVLLSIILGPLERARLGRSSHCCSRQWFFQALSGVDRSFSPYIHFGNFTRRGHKKCSRISLQSVSPRISCFYFVWFVKSLLCIFNTTLGGAQPKSPSPLRSYRDTRAKRGWRPLGAVWLLDARVLLLLHFCQWTCATATKYPSYDTAPLFILRLGLFLAYICFFLLINDVTWVGFTLINRFLGTRAEFRKLYGNHVHSSSNTSSNSSASSYGSSNSRNDPLTPEQVHILAVLFSRRFSYTRISFHADASSSSSKFRFFILFHFFFFLLDHYSLLLFLTCMCADFSPRRIAPPCDAFPLATRKIRRFTRIAT